MKTLKEIISVVIVIAFILNGLNAFAQSKTSIAVIGIDTKGIGLDNTSMGNLIRLELEKQTIMKCLINMMWPINYQRMKLTLIIVSARQN